MQIPYRAGELCRMTSGQPTYCCIRRPVIGRVATMVLAVRLWTISTRQDTADKCAAELTERGGSGDGKRALHIRMPSTIREVLCIWRCLKKLHRVLRVDRADPKYSCGLAPAPIWHA